MSKLSLPPLSQLEPAAQSAFRAIAAWANTIGDQGSITQVRQTDVATKQVVQAAVDQAAKKAVDSVTTTIVRRSSDMVRQVLENSGTQPYIAMNAPVLFQATSTVGAKDYKLFIGAGGLVGGYSAVGSASNTPTFGIATADGSFFFGEADPTNTLDPAWKQVIFDATNRMVVFGSGITIKRSDGVTTTTLEGVARASEYAAAALAHAIQDNAATILTGTITPQDSGGIKVGSLTWNSTNGELTGGSGIAITEYGIVGAKAGVAKFTIDASGNATFGGSLSAATGTFAGSLSAATGTFGGDVTTSGDGQFYGRNTSSRYVDISGASYSVDYSLWADATSNASAASNVRSGVIGYSAAATSMYNVGVIGIGPSTTNGIGVVGSGGLKGGYFSTSNPSGYGVECYNSSGGAALYVNGQSTMVGNVWLTGTLTATGNIGAYNTSDRRLKKRLAAIGGALDSVSRLNGYRFQWKDSWLKKQGGHDGRFVRRHDVGLIAQDVLEVLPEAVVEKDDGYLGVAYEKLIPLLVEAVKELDRRTR